MLRLIFMRHGDYYDMDDIKGLTDKGQQQVVSTAEQLRDQFNVKVDGLYMSMEVRAIQSAGNAAPILGFEGRPQHMAVLNPGEDMKLFLEFLKTRPTIEETVLCLSHEPNSFDVGTYYVGNAFAGPLKKGSALLLGFSAESWEEISPKNCQNYQLVEPKLVA